MTKIIAAVALGLLVSACVPAAPPPWLVQPANPHLGLRSPRYANVTAGVQKFDVVEPKDWRELNRAVGPQSGGGGSGMGGMNHSMEGMGMGGGKRDTGNR